MRCMAATLVTHKLSGNQTGVTGGRERSGVRAEWSEMDGQRQPEVHPALETVCRVQRVNGVQDNHQSNMSCRERQRVRQRLRETENARADSSEGDKGTGGSRLEDQIG